MGDINHLPMNMALYDLMGKYLGLPVWKLLGPKVRSWVPVAAWTVSQPPDAMAAEVREAARRSTPYWGYRWLKYHVDEIQNVIDQTAAMQKAAPRGFRIHYDFNANSTYSAVYPVLRELGRFSVAGRVEDPITAKDRDGWRMLRQKCRIPILGHHVPVEFMLEKLCDGLLMPKAAPTEKDGGKRQQGLDVKVPDPPDKFTGTAPVDPVDNGSLVSLKDGRLMMVGSATRVSFSKDGGRTWTPATPLTIEDKLISSAGDPTSLIRLKSGKLALLYGRDAKAVGAPPGHDLFFRTSDDEGDSWSEEKQINVPGVTASPYHDVLTQLESGRLVLPVRWLISGRFSELKGAGAFGTFQGKRFHVAELRGTCSLA